MELNVTLFTLLVFVIFTILQYLIQNDPGENTVISTLIVKDTRIKTHFVQYITMLLFERQLI